jgi:hypothetical protein
VLKHRRGEARAQNKGSGQRVLADLLPGDRLSVVTPGKSLGLEAESAGKVVAVWPVAQVVSTSGDDPRYPARKYQHRVPVNEIEAIHLDQPVFVDHIIRGDGYDRRIAARCAVSRRVGEDAT